jgi:prepilin-type processing-associated H-X9-DG protein
VDVPKQAGPFSIWKLVMPALAYTRSRQEGREFLLVASSRRALLKAIRQSGFEKSSLAEKADFKRCLGDLRQRWSSALYADPPRILDFLRGSIPTESGGEQPGPLAPSEVASAIAPHLFGFGMVSDESRDVSFQESYGPLGPLTGAGLLALATLEGRADAGASRTPEADAANLARIGVGLQLYATDFDRFPTALSELHDEYVGSLEHFNAPGGKREVRAEEDIDTKSDYAYVPGLRPTDLSDMILVYSKEYVHGGRGRNVLFLDGRVHFLPEAGFQATLKGQTSSTAGR